MTLLAPAMGQIPPDLANRSIEDLMSTDVTSAGKKEQPIARVPSAIHVITSEDIRLSGATNLPDLLRMAPGVHVAQINAHQWAVSARGFAGGFANKMLVLVDGRAVYDPLFSGVIWDSHSMPLEDIDRIEVIRGPGSTVWGTNAVNGVINIITKGADRTQGALVTAGGGSVDRGFASVRYGDRAGRNGYYRMFAHAFDRAENVAQQVGDNDFRVIRGGFRGDWSLSAADKVTLEGDVMSVGERGPVDLGFDSLSTPLVHSTEMNVGTGSLLGRWTHTHRSGVQTTLQAYYDVNQRTLEVPLLRRSGFDIQRHTFDVDFEQHCAIGERHDLVWGAGFRAARDHTTGQLNITFSPDHRALRTLNTFLQDEIELIRRRVWLTLGTKFERNDFSGWQVEPSVKALWTATARQSLWAAVSRAHRIPSRTDADYRIDLITGVIQNGLPVIARMMGNPSFQSETMIGYEAGYRAQLTKRLTVDLAIYRNRYTNLRTNEPGDPFVDAHTPQPALILPIAFGNQAFGTTRGVEADANWAVRPWWSVSGYYAHFQAVINRNPASRDDRVVELLEGQVPRNTWNLTSTWRLPRRWEFTQSLYQYGKQSYGKIENYYRWDARLAWRASEQVEFSLNGQNLLDARHIEYAPAADLFLATPVKRAFYAKVTWRL